MKKYIRCHLVEAEPMTRGEHIKSKGLSLIPGSGSESDDGYRVVYPDGYQSWCPKAQFEAASSPEALYEVLKEFHDEHYADNPEGLTLDLVKAFYDQFVYKPCMTFGMAIEAMKQGKKVARAGWNGKGMWLCVPLCDGPKEIPATGIWGKPNAEYAEQNGGTVKVMPYITMKAADGTIVMGWLASQTDMLSDDWVIVD